MNAPAGWPESFFSVCERIWQDWLSQREPELPASLRGAFDFDYSPEPYTIFDEATRPLVVLTTNPGGPREHQSRGCVARNDRPPRANATYWTAARELGHHYRRELRGKQAGRRIESMIVLAAALGFDGVLQVEACPFRSASMPTPTKTAWMKAESNGLPRTYLSALRDLLDGQHVVAIAATSSLVASPWINWLCDLVGLPTGQIRREPILHKGAKITCSVLLPTASFNRHKAVVLMMGANQLPGEVGRRRLVAAIQDRPHHRP
jgi:hypothetical protein